MQLGFLEEASDAGQVEDTLSAHDERILKELLSRRRGKRR
jgi:hypothetical protein